MNRNEILPRISTFLARFTQEVRQLNGAGLYDINIHSENVLIPLLQVVFDFNGLQNANAIVKNAPGIDLIDYDARVSVQVTATADAQKISDSLTKFKAHDQHRAFDKIIFYILTERQDTYRKDFSALLPDGFDFQVDRDIIDNTTLFDHISKNVLSVQKLKAIEKILSDEFSEVKIQERDVRLKHRTGVDSTGTELYHPNMVQLIIPQTLYQADIEFEFEPMRKKLAAHLKRVKNFRKLKHISGRDVVNYALKTFQDPSRYIHDFILRNGKIYTFRDLYSRAEPMRKAIDAGTITALTVEEYINDNDDHRNNMRDLINSTLKSDLLRRQIEWIAEEKLYRFAIGRALNAKKVSYKERARKVIFEVLSKPKPQIVVDADGNERTEQEQHIVCFRHLAFAASINDFGDSWYMSIKPEWMFTSVHNGTKKSAYSAFYLKGIKEFEWNDTIFDQFTFLAEYLATISAGDMFGSFTIKILPLDQTFTCEWAVPDKIWNQTDPKAKGDKDQLKLFGE